MSLTYTHHYTMTDAARHLGVKRKKLVHWCKKGYVRSVTRNDHRTIHGTELAALHDVLPLYRAKRITLEAMSDILKGKWVY